MGVNSTGQSDSRDYVVGRGGVYLALINSTTGYPLSYRYLGNTPEFSTTLDVQELLHQSSQQGIKVTDKRVEISRTIGIKFALDEVSQQNVALFFAGLVSSVTNPAVAGVGGVGTEIIIATSCELGVWYDLRDSNGVRMSITDTSKFHAMKDPAGVNTALDSTDFILDADMGRIFLKSTATHITAGSILGFYVAADATAPAALKVMEGLTDTQHNYALKFICLNASESDEPIEFQFHSVSISPDGDSALLGDDWLKMSFKGTAEQNSLLQKTVSVTTLR